MSTISPQIDELRATAEEIDWEFPFVASRLRGAAGTITELQAENVKLRELVRDMMVAWWACDDERCPRHDKRCEEGKFCAFDECARDLGIEAGE